MAAATMTMTFNGPMRILRGCGAQTI